MRVGGGEAGAERRAVAVYWESELANTICGENEGRTKWGGGINTVEGSIGGIMPGAGAAPNGAAKGAGS